MPRKLICRFVAIAASSLVLITSAAPPSMARPPTSPNIPFIEGGAAVASVAPLTPELARTVNGASASAADYERVLSAYWTPERMRAARPAEEALASRAKGFAPAPKPVPGGTQVPQELRGEPAIIHPSSPTAEPVSAGIIAELSEETGSGKPFKPNLPIGHQVARTSGKVFFTHMGVDQVCSAGVVESSGRSLVWTAGHCVYDNGHFAANWIFVPNYNVGKPYPQSPAPYGYWYARHLAVQQAWLQGQWHGDVGAAIMWPSPTGVPIQSALGAQGISFSLPYYPYVNAYGYPAEPPYDGEHLYCSVYQAQDAGASTIYIMSSMTGGASGGYWLTNFNGAYGYVNGHNSFGLYGLPYVFSPYYGRDTKQFYDKVEHVQWSDGTIF